MPDIEITIPKDELNLTTTREEKALQDIADGVTLDSEVVPVDPRQSIYAKFDKVNRPSSEAQPPMGEDIPPDNEEDVNIPVEELEQVKIKVYGREILVDKAKVDAAGGVKEYQKMVAANEKAQIERDKEFIAAEKKRLEDERLEVERLKKETPPPGVSEKKPADLPPDDHGDELELVKKAGDRLMDGDVDGYTEIMAKVLAKKSESKPSIDIDQITSEVESRTIRNMTLNQRKIEVRKAQEEFSAEYPELIADPELFKKVDNRTIILQREHPDKSPLEILRLAGDEVTTLYVKPKVKVTPPLDKKAEKRAMVTPRTGTARAVAPPAPKVATKSDYVEALRKSRGQALN